MAKPSAAKKQIPESQEQVKANPKSYAGEKVIICSKLEMSLTLQLERWEVETRKDRSVTWRERVSKKYGPVVTINGTAFPIGDGALGLERPDMTSGVALTYNIDRSWWECWSAEHADYEPLRAGFIYAATTRDDAKAHAKEITDMRSGFGPLEHAKNAEGDDMITDYRRPKKTPTRTRPHAGMSEEWSPEDHIGLEPDMEVGLAAAD